MISNEWFEEQDAREDIKWSAEYDRRVEVFKYIYINMHIGSVV